ncbi:MAG: hypothetical protein HY744_23555 [Deltaproteobacteria bacterium]|nr:hypothetical protein [Deltaproteobacteria bacterium]
MSKALGRLWRWLSGRPEPPSAEEAAELARLFRNRYQDFRGLLAANSEALELMAEVQLGAAGERAPDPSELPASLLQLHEQVGRMVASLERMAPGRFDALQERLAAIGAEIQGALGGDALGAGDGEPSGKDREGDLASPEAPANGGARPATPEALVSGGVRASPGAAVGPVYWVKRDADARDLPDGALLLLDVPAPRWAPLLGRAAAVAAVHGSLAGHLATVARELGKPALFDLGAQLERLQTGTQATLDADGRAIYAGRIAAPLLARSAALSDGPLRDCPGRARLEQALRHVTPLTLLDPDEPAFRPESCRTLHDITRFCHEMSVREMFGLGRQSPLPRHAGRQLYFKVPMQWWVLDLDDGVREGPQGKYVRLEDIRSAPMLAVWEGMTAIPWDGPPLLSGRGLASVMFEATANPGLATPFGQPYAERNYFMIASDFMNLQSRFGFHFATVEALVGERTGENYICFAFKGGAADPDRRLRRVELIGALLEEQGFEVQIHDDLARARFAGAGAGPSGDKLKVVGYLLIHTRQLDMIMGDAALVRRYQAKMEADIEKLAGGGP